MDEQTGEAHISLYALGFGSLETIEGGQYHLKKEMGYMYDP
jgi:hypothetical protein